MIRKEKGNGSGKVKVTFVVPDCEGMGKVSVVGDFNEWSPDATRLVRRSNGTRSASMTLAKNERYAFRYVSEDGDWFNDEAADEWVPNGFGSDNCVVRT